MQHAKHYTTIKTTNIMQHANQNITLLSKKTTNIMQNMHYYKNYQYNATCKIKTLH